MEGRCLCCWLATVVVGTCDSFILIALERADSMYDEMFALLLQGFADTKLDMGIVHQGDTMEYRVVIRNRSTAPQIPKP